MASPATGRCLKDFPGGIGPTTSYHYTTLDLDLAALTFHSRTTPSFRSTLTVSFATTFLSAYFNSYDPAKLSANYLGDDGSSGHFGRRSFVSFQVFVPYGNHLELVLNESTTNGGVGLPAGVTVEAFVTRVTRMRTHQRHHRAGTGYVGTAGVRHGIPGGAAARKLRSAGGRYGARMAALVLASLCGPFLFGQGTIDPNAVDQISALLQEKETRTSDQQKLDSQLWYALQASRGQTLAGVSDVYATAVDAVQPDVSGLREWISARTYLTTC